MSNIEYRRKLILTLVISICTVILSNWGSIAYQNRQRNEQVQKNTVMIQQHEDILKSKVSRAENNQAHATLLQQANTNKEVIEEMKKKIEKDNEFVIENILEIKNQLIELNSKN